MKPKERDQNRKINANAAAITTTSWNEMKRNEYHLRLCFLCSVWINSREREFRLCFRRIFVTENLTNITRKEEEKQNHNAIFFHRRCRYSIDYSCLRPVRISIENYLLLFAFVLSFLFFVASAHDSTAFFFSFRLSRISTISQNFFVLDSKHLLSLPGTIVRDQFVKLK